MQVSKAPVVITGRADAPAPQGPKAKAPTNTRATAKALHA